MVGVCLGESDAEETAELSDCASVCTSGSDVAWSTCRGGGDLTVVVCE